LNGCQAFAGQGERFIPANFRPFITCAPHRPVQAVRIAFQIEDGIAFRADVSAAERIGGIAADGDQLFVLVLQLESADGFAQRTGAVSGMAGHGDGLATFGTVSLAGIGSAG
jgi:hypothetical protein